MRDEIPHKGAKVYIYTRVSTSRQVDGYSLDAQRDEILREVRRHEMIVCGEYSDEGKSGKSISGRPQFQKMLEDIESLKDGVTFVLVYKLSRFGRNTAEILNTLRTIRRYGVYLICVKDNIDSSMESGRLLISILGSMAEIERENILVQTMSGRQEKARQGRWNGAKAPYGYTLEDGNLIIKADEAVHVQKMFELYVSTNKGYAGVAKWLNDHGYEKVKTTYNGLSVFTGSFVEGVINNPIYIGKIVYGRRYSVLKEGSDNEFETKEIKDKNKLAEITYEGEHKAIIAEDIWDAAQKKMESIGGRKEKLEKEHEYIYSALLKCPLCGKSLYGVPIKGRRKKKDGSFYPTYYSYMCRSDKHTNGLEKCKFGQIACNKIDGAMQEILISIVNEENFASVMQSLIDDEIDVSDLEMALETALKKLRQAKGRQRKIETEMDDLDVYDVHYDLEYASLKKRLHKAFDEIDESEKQIDEIEAKIESVKQQGLTQKSIYQALLLFERYFKKMSDYEKKQFVQTFIESIELYPDKSRKNGYPIKTIHFRFPVAYNGEVVYDISPPKEKTVEALGHLCKISSGEEE